MCWFFSQTTIVKNQAGFTEIDLFKNSPNLLNFMQGDDQELE